MTDTTEFVDDRADNEHEQGTLAVGDAAERTAHRDGKTGSSTDFQDVRDPDRDTGEQRQLFPDVDDEQATLGGDQAATRCLFSED